MITVEYNLSSNDVGLSFDREGGDLLMSLLQDMLERRTADHVHLTSGAKEIAGWTQRPENYALSETKLNSREEAKVASLLTLVFRP